MDLHVLTTTDNPYSPVTQYDEWFAWDMARYNTNSLLARVVRTSTELSESDQELAIELAIDEIVRENVSGMHIRVRADSETSAQVLSDVNNIKNEADTIDKIVSDS